MAELDIKTLFSLLEGYRFHISDLPKFVEIIKKLDLTKGHIGFNVTIDTPTILTSTRMFFGGNWDLPIPLDDGESMFDVLVAEAKRYSEVANV